MMELDPNQHLEEPTDAQVREMAAGLRDENDAFTRYQPMAADFLEALLRRAKEAEAQVEGCRGALEPFLTRARNYDDAHADESDHFLVALDGIPIGDFRGLLALLKEPGR